MPKEVKEYPPIPEPELTPGPNTLSLLYKALNIEIRTARLTETSRGRVLGEVEIIRPIPDDPEDKEGETLLHVTTGFDFHSNSYRSDLIRSMAHKVNSLDWQGLVEDICDRVIKHQRRGDPEAVIDVKKIVFHKPSYLLYPYLPHGQPCIIVGKKKSLKTTLVMTMAVVLAGGWTSNPFGFIGVANHPHKILWLDWETDQEGFEYDLMRIIEGMGEKQDIADNIIYRHCRGSLIDQVEQIKYLVNKYNIDLIILDSIAPASGGDIKNAETAIKYHSALRYLDRASCSLAHPPKSELLTETTVTGAGQFEDLARIIWETKKEQEEDTETAHQAIFHLKPYKTGTMKPAGLRYEFSEDAIIIVQENPRLINSFKPRMSLNNQIFDLLRSGEKPIKDIQLTTGKPYTHVYNELKRMLAKGTIILNDNGLYGLP
ncbi:MAG: AAA family ATPase, partial [Dehalococcoidia bacterium]|nr:AAA family ATPase [Dehalococcoidia bacterium]